MRLYFGVLRSEPSLENLLGVAGLIQDFSILSAVIPHPLSSIIIRDSGVIFKDSVNPSKETLTQSASAS